MQAGGQINSGRRRLPQHQRGVDGAMDRGRDPVLAAQANQRATEPRQFEPAATFQVCGTSPPFLSPAAGVECGDGPGRPVGGQGDTLGCGDRGHLGRPPLLLEQRPRLGVVRTSPLVGGSGRSAPLTPQQHENFAQIARSIRVGSPSWSTPARARASRQRTTQAGPPASASPKASIRAGTDMADQPGPLDKKRRCRRRRRHRSARAGGRAPARCRRRSGR